MRSLLRFYDERTSSTNLQDLAPNKRLDVQTLAAYLCQTTTANTSRTIYEGVRSEILPTTWSLGVETSDLPIPRNVSEAQSQTRTMVYRVLERAIGSATRVAVFGGGGIDSSIVLTITSEILAKRGGTVFAVTQDFQSPGDDRPHLKTLEAHLGCEVIRVDTRDAARHLEPVKNGLDGAPMLWPYSPLQLALFEEARKHGAERVLTGIGGDDFFDGDPRSLRELVKRHPLDAIHRARTLEGFWQPRSPVFDYLVRPTLAKLIPHAIRRARGRRSRFQSPHPTVKWAGPELRRAADTIAERSLEHSLTHSHATAPTEDYFEWPGQRYFAWLIHQEQRGGLVDRYDPLLTEEVAAMIRRFPSHYLLAGNRRRGLLRASMRGKVPDSILDRTDKAEFSVAFPAFLDAVNLQKTFGEELEGRSLARLGIVDRNVFRREITHALEEPDYLGVYGLAWAALAAESFLLSHPHLV